MSALDETFRCSRGWLLEPQSDGTVLPFFLKIRYNDIIVYPDMIYEDELIAAMEGIAKISYTPAIMEATVNDWKVKIDNTGCYTATKNIKIDSVNVGKIDSEVEYLTATLTLPFTTFVDDLNVSISGNGISKAFASASYTSVLGNKTGSTGSYVAEIGNTVGTELFVHIAPSENIPETITGDPGLFITVSGNIYTRAPEVIPEEAEFSSYGNFDAIKLV